MRYIGNKTKILDEIDNLLKDKNLKNNKYVFFDAFSGTASVSTYFKNDFKIISNDNLSFASMIADAKLNSHKDMFKSLGFDPFEFLNNQDFSNTIGFIANNFSPLGDRSYFSEENSKIIDGIRITINDWYDNNKINNTEKSFLIASLIESVSKVANVAGVYGACLKTWDPRAVKKMKFLPIVELSDDKKEATIYNDNILNVISKVNGDILYLDPPYTKNQYSTQYHLLETIALYDNPVLKGKTGARDMSSCSSDFSKVGNVHVVFEKLISQSKFKHIILSYSSDGLMSKEFIEAIFKRYGKKDTYEIRKINYRRYKNHQAEDKEDHQEYLFYVEKKDEKDVTFSSPLNYIGGKYDMIPFLKEHMPSNINTFYDLFGGGANLSINVSAQKVIYNDVNFIVKNLLENIAKCDLLLFYKYILKTISSFGLAKNEKEPYLKLREKYNSKKLDDRDFKDLFLLIMYGFQQQIRFNGSYEYNNPVGQAFFNDYVLEKLITFHRKAQENHINFMSQDYVLFEDEITNNDFVYCDPPYLITLGSYNDGKRGFNGWSESEEKRLLDFLLKLHNKNIKFMLSNVLEHNGKTNEILKNWIKENNFNLIQYEQKSRGREEIIVINY